MSLQVHSPPKCEDVELEDYGPYSRSELVAARASLISTVQDEPSIIWHRIRSKLGILPDGRRLSKRDLPHVWIPDQLPWEWSAPIALQQADVCQAQYSAHQVQPPETAGMKAPWGSGAFLLSSNPGSTSESVASSSSNALVHVKVCPDSGEQNGGGGHRESVLSDTVQVKREASSELNPEPAVAASPSKQSKKKKSNKPMYEAMFCCDLCDEVQKDRNSMEKHLQKQSHYSASLCLGFIDSFSGEMSPKFVHSISALKDSSALLKYKIPTCHECNKFFVDVKQCVDHYAQKHNRTGRYSLCSVVERETYGVIANTHKCLVCDRVFPSGANSLRRHMADTQHMKEPDRFMIFPCTYCSHIFTDIIEYRRHVANQHGDKIRSKKSNGIFCITVGKPQPPLELLPENYGIPEEKIIIRDAPHRMLSHLRCFKFNTGEKQKKKKKKRKKGKTQEQWHMVAMSCSNIKVQKQKKSMEVRRRLAREKLQKMMEQHSQGQ